jgi:hypothetical protein
LCYNPLQKWSRNGSAKLNPNINMQPNPDQPKSLEITGDSKPKVPVFTCTVYVHKTDDATVIGRVANLAGIEASGTSEREVLSKVAREFKSRVFKIRETGQEIPWIDPPQPPLENEQVRSIPVHL